MREHFIPQHGVNTYNTKLSSKGTFVIPRVTPHGLNHSTSTGVHCGTHYHICWAVFNKSYSTMYQCFYQLWLICLDATRLL